jgi:hypothetical protein
MQYSQLWIGLKRHRVLDMLKNPIVQGAIDDCQPILYEVSYIEN